MFQMVRNAFAIRVNGNPSDHIPYMESDIQAHDKCNLIIDRLIIYLYSYILFRIYTAVKTIQSCYRKREGMLFINNIYNTITITNNRMERFGMKITRNTRKRRGSSDTSNIMSQNGTKTVLFWNIGNREYLHALFGTWISVAILHLSSRNTGNLSGGRTVKKNQKACYRMQKMILHQSSPETPYTVDIFERAKKLKLGVPYEIV